MAASLLAMSTAALQQDMTSRRGHWYCDADADAGRNPTNGTDTTSTAALGSTSAPSCIPSCISTHCDLSMAAASTITSASSSSSSQADPASSPLLSCCSSSSCSSSSSSSPDALSHQSPSLRLHSHRQHHNSSKLPTFRSADLTSRRRPHPAQVPASHHHSPASPDPVPGPRLAPSPPHDHHLADVATAAQDGNPVSARPSAVAAPPRIASRPPRASSCQYSRQSAPSPAFSPPQQPPPPPTCNRRSASCPPGPGPILAVQSTPLSSSATDSFAAHSKPFSRRGPAPRTSHGASSLHDPPEASDQQQPRASGAAACSTLCSQDASEPLSSGSVAPQNQVQPHLCQPSSESSSSPDESRSSLPSRPPISYRSIRQRHSIQIGQLPPGQVPPIRSFRSSGSRRSLTKGMNFTPRPYDVGESYANSPEEESTSNFGGDYVNGAVVSRKSDSDRNEDAGDVFLRIAREEPTRRFGEEDTDATLTSTVRLPALYPRPDDVDLMEMSMPSQSALKRSSHRRPLSTVAATYHPSSPPAARRLSDHQESPRLRFYDGGDDQRSEISRTTTFRPAAREKAASVHPGEDMMRTRSGGASLRPSPLSARSTVGMDNGQEASVYARRRASIAGSNSLLGARSPAYKTTGPNHVRNYGSSPLAKTVDFQSRSGAEISAHGLEGTESTASTTAPSTVWDELDDLKSRIHRLELTGKLPSTSAAAVSRTSDERPATATTTVTTMSLSPKRQGPAQFAETSSATSSQKEAHPILQAALVKTKPYLSAEVYHALASAAHDAMALSSMMGSAGQPGPVSGAASTIGAGGPVTDRQLRRKADSVCRGLTELCVALGDGAARPPATVVSPSTVSQHDGPATPTLPQPLNGLPISQRPSPAEPTPARPGSSSGGPRTYSKFEERRSLIFNGAAAGSSPRSTLSTPSAPMEGSLPRRPSLMIARTRRAGTEEPPELGRTPSLLRSRRAVTEEPEEGRRFSAFPGRNFQSTIEHDGDEGQQFRPLSRANSGVSMLRGPGRESAAERQQATQVDALSSPQTPSALPRPRFHSTSYHPTRLAGPQGPRRYGDGQDAGQAAAEPAMQRHGPPLSKGIAHTRASSLSTRRTRDRMYPAHTGGGGDYR